MYLNYFNVDLKKKILISSKDLTQMSLVSIVFEVSQILDLKPLELMFKLKFVDCHMYFGIVVWYY